MDVSVNAVSKWERGLNLPDISKMPELCNILEITINELLEGKKLNENDLVEQRYQKFRKIGEYIK